MKAREYLARLAEGLEAAERREGRAVDPTQRREVLAEMESHVEETARRKPGLSEDEVVASLTPPDILAESLYEELAAPIGSGPERGRQAGGRPEAFSTPRDQGFRGRLRRFAGGSRTETLDWSGSLSASGVEELWIEFPVAELEIGPASGTSGEIELECEVEADPSVLETWSPSLVRDGKALLLREGEESQVQRLSLRFPPSIMRLSVETRSGDIELDSEGRDCRIKTASGDVSLESAARASVETASGEVEIGTCEAAAIVTGSGDVSLGEVRESLVVKTGSGAVEVDLASGAVKVESSSGDLELRMEGGRILATTSSGSIDLEADADFEGGSLGTTSGDIAVRLESPRLLVRAESVSGEVCVDDEEGGDRVPRRVVSALGGGGPDLVLRSVSGSVEVELD